MGTQNDYEQNEQNENDCRCSSRDRCSIPSDAELRQVRHPAYVAYDCALLRSCFRFRA